jgi:uncharacterized protein (UPF0332 family)
MTEVALLLVRAQESLAAARLMVREHLPNIAASRAYYTMFYIAEALLLERGQVYSSHSAVIAAFGKEFARTKELPPKFHRYLIASQDTRQIGDYGVERNVSDEDAMQVISWAEEFFKAAEEYLKNNSASPQP